MCNDATCTITTEGGGGTFFLLICGDYTGGILQVTGGNLVSIRQFCASLYNCLDPMNCWMKDIRTGEGQKAVSGVKAVSVMPGCEITGENFFFLFGINNKI